MVIRYQGGNNAGHTVVVNGKSIILNLLPSGVLNTQATCFLSHGMVINPSALLEENIKYEEVNQAIKRLKNGKAAGNDGITAEMLQCEGDVVIESGKKDKYTRKKD